MDDDDDDDDDDIAKGKSLFLRFETTIYKCWAFINQNLLSKHKAISQIFINLFYHNAVSWYESGLQSGKLEIAAQKD